MDLVLFIDLLAVQSRVVKLAEEAVGSQGCLESDRSGSSPAPGSNVRSQGTETQAYSEQDISQMAHPLHPVFLGKT